MRAGETVIDYLSQVEDTKGNNGQTGMYCCYVTMVTSLSSAPSIQVNCL